MGDNRSTFRYHFATLYDTNHRIAVYSAYQFEPSNGGGREKRWFVEPQVGIIQNHTVSAHCLMLLKLLIWVLYRLCIKSTKTCCAVYLHDGHLFISYTLCMSEYLCFSCGLAGGYVLASRDEGWLLAGEGLPWDLPGRETSSKWGLHKLWLWPWSPQPQRTPCR